VFRDLSHATTSDVDTLERREPKAKRGAGTRGEGSASDEEAQRTTSPLKKSAPATSRTRREEEAQRTTSPPKK
jgi:hypothetical protein